MSNWSVVPALALLLAACDTAENPVGAQKSAGAALEQAAVAAGLVPDPDRIDPVGAYASTTDRVCIVPDGDRYRLGASVDYGEQQSCLARGTAAGRATLRVDLGEDCRFEARIDAGRIVFPATLPSACDRRCTGRATLTALSAGLLSNVEAEASAMTAADGQKLCG